MIKSNVSTTTITKSLATIQDLTMVSSNIETIKSRLDGKLLSTVMCFGTGDPAAAAANRNNRIKAVYEPYRTAVAANFPISTRRVSAACWPVG